MTPSEYASAAKQTESTVTTIRFNQPLFTAMAGIIITAGEVLDIVKKSAFYNKAVPVSDIMTHLNQLQVQVHTLPTLMDSLAKKGIQATPQPQVNTRLVHSMLGIVTEAVELLSSLDQYVQTGNLDTVNLAEELGDVDWYQAIGIDELGLTQEQVWDTNINKLHNKRYKNKTFTTEEAVNRDVNSERSQLEIDVNQALNHDHPETTPTEVSAEILDEAVVQQPVDLNQQDGEVRTETLGAPSQERVGLDEKVEDTPVVTEPVTPKKKTRQPK